MDAVMGIYMIYRFRRSIADMAPIADAPAVLCNARQKRTVACMRRMPTRGFLVRLTVSVSFVGRHILKIHVFQFQ